jgi:histidinol dehydrogenase
MSDPIGIEVVDLRGRSERPSPARYQADPAVQRTVAEILGRVRQEGDEALVDLTERFDGANLRESGLRVRPEEIESAHAQLPSDLRGSIDAMIERLRDLHARQIPSEWKTERDGVTFGEIVRSLDRVGCYVPGGRAAYPSTVAMTVVPARVAGVPEVIVCSPPRRDGTVPPAVLYAADRAGADLVVKVGGAQAVGGMAFGTTTIPPVSKVVGPGNVYVTEAKRQLAGLVGVDGLAGPSELVVVAAGGADTDVIAASLVAQAEHDPLATTTLISTDPSLIDRVLERVASEVARAARREIVEQALRRSRALIVADLGVAAEVADALAPEHLHLLLDDAEAFLSHVRNAGAVFVGPWSPVPFGDYGAGSNHVLPTMGTARFSSGLRAADFVTITSVTELDSRAAVLLAPGVAAVARSEGLEGHARAVEAAATFSPSAREAGDDRR